MKGVYMMVPDDHPQAADRLPMVQNVHQQWDNSQPSLSGVCALSPSCAASSLRGTLAETEARTAAQRTGCCAGPPSSQRAGPTTSSPCVTAARPARRCPVSSGASLDATQDQRDAQPRASLLPSHRLTPPRWHHQCGPGCSCPLRALTPRTAVRGGLHTAKACSRAPSTRMAAAGGPSTASSAPSSHPSSVLGGAASARSPKGRPSH